MPKVFYLSKFYDSSFLGLGGRITQGSPFLALEPTQPQIHRIRVELWLPEVGRRGNGELQIHRHKFQLSKMNKL